MKDNLSMKREPLAYLEDIMEAANSILEFTHDLNNESYKGNKLIRSAVERQFEIIGEALKELKNNCSEHFDKISDGQRIISFRNVIAHGYAFISDNLVWEVVTTKLPTLLSEVETIVNSLQ